MRHSSDSSSYDTTFDPVRPSLSAADGSSSKDDDPSAKTSELLMPSATRISVGMTSFLSSLVSMTKCPTDSEFSKIKMEALKLLQQLSKSSEIVTGHTILGGALGDCSMEFRQFVIGETNNHAPPVDEPTGGDETTLNQASRSRKYKSENGSSLGTVRESSCWDGDSESLQTDGSSSKLWPSFESYDGLNSTTRLQKLHPEDFFDPSMRALETNDGSHDGHGQIGASARIRQLTFVKPDTSADSQYSMMRLSPSLIPSAPKGTDIFKGGKVGVFLLKNAGRLKVPSTLVHLDGPTNGWPLTTLCLWIFQKHDIFTSMSIGQNKMSRFLHSVELGYRRDNPYHNRAHAADVTMRMYSLLMNGINVQDMNKQDSCQVLLSCILAAAVHDYMHPGSNNNFQAEVSSEVAQIYNYKSPLENFSASCALALADEIGLFSGMPDKTAKKIRMEIIELVLATDMSNHFDLMSSFGNVVAAKSAESKLSSLGELNLNELDSSTVLQKSFFEEEYETRLLLLRIAMKLSDLGHCCLPWGQHMAWCNRLETEFFFQGDYERRVSVDVSPLMDRQRPGVSNHRNSVGFFRMFVIPMLEQWVGLYPSCKPLIMQARDNLAKHRLLARVSLDDEHTCMASRGGDPSMDRPLSSFTTSSCPVLEINLVPHPAAEL